MSHRQTTLKRQRRDATVELIAFVDAGYRCLSRSVEYLSAHELDGDDDVVVAMVCEFELISGAVGYALLQLDEKVPDLVAELESQNRAALERIHAVKKRVLDAGWQLGVVGPEKAAA